MLTRDERYRLISFGEDEVAAAVYGQAERVFLESIGSTARTNTNEIAYWKDRYNEQFKANGDRLFIFGFQEDNELIGFALVFYFKRHSLVVVDHMAIKEPARHFGTFYTFKDMIADHLCALDLEIDYTIAEIVVSKLGDPHPVDPQLLIQLLKQQGFKVAHLPYYTPSIREEEYSEKIEAALMIQRRERGCQMRSTKLMALLDCLLFDLYVRWYTPHSHDMRAFRSQIRRLRKLYSKELLSAPSVELNGNWMIPHRPLPETGNGTSSEAGSFVMIFGLMLILAAMSALLSGLSYFFKISVPGIALIFSAVLFALLTILAVWHKTASAQADKVLRLIVTLVRGHKKIS
jgi:hypothetical protein